MKVTGVGSLPHVDPVAAARFVLETTDIPYLPQLPRRHREEGMLAQWGDGLCGLGAADADPIGLAVGAPPGPREEAFVGAATAMEAFASENVDVVKTQMTGPITLGLAALAAGRRIDGLWRCVVDGLARRAAAHVAAIAERLPEAELHLVVDEPSLVAFAPGRPQGPISAADAESVLSDFFAALGGPAGLHCCGDTDWGMVARLRPDRISLDVLALGDGFVEHAAELAAAIGDGTGLVWGLAPSRPGPVDRSVVQRRYGTAMARLVMEGAPTTSLIDDAWASPSCGLAATTPKAAAAVMSELRDIVGGLHVR